MTRLIEKLSYSNVMATVAVFIALGAGAYAAGLSRDSVKSKQIAAGAVRTSELAGDAVTSSKVADSSLVGADFAPGELSTGGTPIWAVVTGPGMLVQGSHAVSAQRLFVGQGRLGTYQVTFDRDVTQCALIATLAVPDSQAADQLAGEVQATYREDDATAAFVRTRASGGAEANRAFQIAAIC